MNFAFGCTTVPDSVGLRAARRTSWELTGVPKSFSWFSDKSLWCKVEDRRKPRISMQLWVHFIFNLVDGEGGVLILLVFSDS